MAPGIACGLSELLTSVAPGLVGSWMSSRELCSAGKFTVSVTGSVYAFAPTDTATAIGTGLSPS